MRARYGGRPAQERPLSCDVAVLDAYAGWRVWIAEQLSHLPESAAAGIERRLWLDEHFWPTLMELGAGAALRLIVPLLDDLLRLTPEERLTGAVVTHKSSSPPDDDPAFYPGVSEAILWQLGL